MLRKVVLALGLVLAFVARSESLAAEVRQPNKVYRIGVLSPFSASFGPGPSYDAFPKALRELGYVEGRNISFEYRWADGQFNRLPELAAELVRLRVDVIFTAWGTLTALASKKATGTVPIVFAGVGDAVGVGLIPSLAHPASNVTGSTFITEETIGKQLQLLKELAPGVSRVGVVINPSNPVYGPILKASEAPARALGLDPAVVGVQRTEDFDAAVRTAIRAHIDGLVVLRDPILLINREKLVALAAENRLPTVYGMREFAESGGLISYGPDLAEMYRRAAHLVAKIFNGARPADLPIEQPTKFELIVNLKTAKALGLTIPQSLLVRADEVIQ
jgi:putative ABC transport system substrate-binding protein